MMYDYDGYGARDYRVLTMDWAKKAAAGDARAQFEIGQCYFFGKSMPQDEEKAIKWYRRAAEGGCTKTMYELTLCNLDATDFGIDDSEIVKWTEKFDMAYLKAAQEGDVEAISVMADRYLTGWGVERDIQKAIELGTKAAELGDWRTAEMLSKMYRCGHYVQKDEEKADMWGRKNIELFQKKAESGELHEQELLGFPYESGSNKYLERNADKAIEWYTRAAR